MEVVELWILHVTFITQVQQQKEGELFSNRETVNPAKTSNYIFQIADRAC